MEYFIGFYKFKGLNLWEGVMHTKQRALGFYAFQLYCLDTAILITENEKMGINHLFYAVHLPRKKKVRDTRDRNGWSQACSGTG